MGFDPWVRKIPWRRKWQPSPVYLLSNFGGTQYSIVNYLTAFFDIDSFTGLGKNLVLTALYAVFHPFLFMTKGTHLKMIWVGLEVSSWK